MPHPRRHFTAAALAWLAFPAGASAALPMVLHLPEGLSADTRDEAHQWVLRSGRAVTDYLGRFPAPQAALTVVTVDGAGVRSGLTFDGPPPGIRVTIGRNTPHSGFLSDWVLVHEMVHLALPQLPRRHNWFHEGAATYVEIIARARAGLTSPDFAWGQFVGGLPNGLPQPGDEGMDRTRRWGLTYWGGALFCLLAELTLRERSEGRVGFQQAMQGILAAGGHYGERWSMARTLQAADQATGMTVLADLYAQMKDQAVATDLSTVWQRLGLEVQGQRMRLADNPAAALRRSIIAE
jgi:hypothetical protein